MKLGGYLGRASNQVGIADAAKPGRQGFSAREQVSGAVDADGADGWTVRGHGE
jgi:hypothetical protein